MDNFESYRHIRKISAARGARAPDAWAAAYVSLRKALGFRSPKTGEILRHLLRFMRDRGIVSFNQVDRNLAMAWLHSGSPQEITINQRLATMRGFFRYLVSLGAARGSIWDSIPHRRTKRFIPYVFSLAEIRTILDHLHRGIDTSAPRLARTRAAYYVMVHTLYACGLRLGELCRLRIADISFERSLFVIKDTKFGKTRLVPFNSRTRELVNGYLDRHRPSDDGAPRDAPLFLNFRRRRFIRVKFSDYFRKMCTAIGIYRRKETRGMTVHGGTTPHALRHTFAVHRLLKWYEEKADVNAKLPLLATYMGHSDYRDTQKYLRVLPRFIDIAGKLFADKFEAPLKDLE